MGTNDLIAKLAQQIDFSLGTNEAIPYALAIILQEDRSGKTRERRLK